MHESFNHEKLHQVLSNKKNWMMTYNDCTYIRELYHSPEGTYTPLRGYDYIILDVDWSYGMNKSKESSEIVIIKLDD